MEDLLLISDIQDQFLQPVLLPVLAALRRRCHDFMAQSKPILTTLQHGYGGLHSSLDELLAGYSEHHSVVKYADEGSTEVARCVQKLNRPVRSILLGGVNACCCVLGTGSGLVGIGYQVVLEDDLIGCTAEHARLGQRTRNDCLQYLRDNLRKEPYPYVQLLRQWDRQLV